MWSREPLYGFHGGLLKMLFMGTDVSFAYENASVVSREDPGCGDDANLRKDLAACLSGWSAVSCRYFFRKNLQ